MGTTTHYGLEYQGGGEAANGVVATQVLADDVDTALWNHATAGVLDHPNNSVTDAKIGNRTPDETVAAASGAQTVTSLFSMLANMVKAITGGLHWYTAPVNSIKGLLDSAAGHKHTGTVNDGPKIAYGDLTGVPGALPPNGAASGDLTGTYPGPTIAAGAVTTTKLAANAATNAQAAFGTSGGTISSTSSTPADMDMSVTITTGGGVVLVEASATLRHSVAGGEIDLYFHYDAGNTDPCGAPQFDVAFTQQQVVWRWWAALAAGTYTISARWATPSGGTMAAMGAGDERMITAVEYKR